MCLCSSSSVVDETVLTIRKHRTLNCSDSSYRSRFRPRIIVGFAIVVLLPTTWSCSRLTLLITELNIFSEDAALIYIGSRRNASLWRPSELVRYRKLERVGLMRRKFLCLGQPVCSAARPRSSITLTLWFALTCCCFLLSIAAAVAATTISHQLLSSRPSAVDHHCFRSVRCFLLSSFPFSSYTDLVVVILAKLPTNFCAVAEHLRSPVDFQLKLSSASGYH